jgi:hypothetical protein
MKYPSDPLLQHAPPTLHTRGPAIVSGILHYLAPHLAPPIAWKVPPQKLSLRGARAAEGGPGNEAISLQLNEIASSPLRGSSQ